jgi:DNA-directed RNA polymerase subunit H (RpoH/RPB5)
MNLQTLTEEILNKHFHQASEEEKQEILKKYQYYDADLPQRGFSIYSTKYLQEKGLI